MNAAKAYAGGIAAALTDVLLYFADLLPVIHAMPPNIHEALKYLVMFACTALAVYHTPNSSTPTT